MQEVLRIILIIIAFNIGLVAYFLALRSLFPKRVAKTRSVADLMPGRSFAVGLVNFLFFGTLAFILISLSDKVGDFGKVILFLPAFICLTILGVGFSLGLCGLAELVGERLAPAQTAFRRTLWGTLTLSLGASLPFVGWFLLLPYSGLVGLGAFIVGFVWKGSSTL
jgi:hypothetical protein